MFGLGDVRVTFGDRLALDGVSLDVPPGQVTAVVGGDGAGKTTLVRTLAGLVQPASGTVDAPRGRALGMQPATAGSWLNLTCRQNMDFVADAYRLPQPDRRIADLLERAGLAAASDRLAAQLSGGMRRKLGLMMSLLPEPDLLLLDEPSTGVDPVSRVELWRLICDATAAGTAVLTTTTYLDEAERAADVLVLHDGRPLLQGDPVHVVGEFPGTFSVHADRPAGMAWRRGRGYHAWNAAGGRPIEPDLTDVVVAASLQREEAAA